MSTEWTRPDVLNAIGVCVSALLGIGGIVLGARQEARARRAEIRELNRLEPKIRVTLAEELTRGDESKPRTTGVPKILTVKVMNVGMEMVVVERLDFREMRRGKLRVCMYWGDEPLPLRVESGEYFKRQTYSSELIAGLKEAGVGDEFTIVAVCVDSYGKEYISNQVSGDMSNVLL
jgi:hypothetical protein